MTLFTAFYFVDAGTETTHLLAWDPDSRQWVVPCDNIDRPPRDSVTYAPSAPLCRSCVNLTQPTRPHRTTNEEPMSDSTSDRPFA